jgi:DNA-binding LytR/AlgR family response regulator
VRQLDTGAYVIFVSAYQRYELEGYRSRAVDFLVKPFTQAQFSQCVSAVLAEIYRARPIMPLTVNSGSRTHLLDQSDITICLLKRQRRGMMDTA